LIIEDAPEVISVGKDLILVRQVRAATIHQIDTGQVVLFGDLLRTQMLFDREREVCTTFDGGIVREDHALAV